MSATEARPLGRGNRPQIMDEFITCHVGGFTFLEIDLPTIQTMVSSDAPIDKAGHALRLQGVGLAPF